MKFENNSYATQPEILKRKLGGELLVPITVAAAAFTEGVCKAGTALAEGGTKAVETAASGDTPASSTAIGILLNDVSEDNPNGSLIKGFAAVSKANIKANTGADVTAGVIATLSNISFE